MKAIVLVAHPDDCAIFAWPFIEAYPEFKWDIVYLTYTPWEPRAREATAFWDTKNINTIFLGYRDEWESVKDGNLGFDAEQAERELSNIAGEYDLILTHFEDGDYGHIHHKFVHNAVEDHTNVITFSESGQNSVTYSVPPEQYSLNELPLHADVIKIFHNDSHSRSYNIPTHLLDKGN